MQSKNLQKVIWFLAITFTATYGACLLMYLQGGAEPLAFLPLVMFIPMLSAFFVQKVVFREPVFKGAPLGFRIGKPGYLLLAPVLILILMTLIYAVTTALHPGLLITEADFMAGIAKSNMPAAGSTLSTILLLLALNIGLAPVLNLPILLGEEVGWRGFLYPNLVARFKKPGLVIGGIIWGAWHFPLIFMGLNYPTNPVTGCIFMVFLCVGMGIVLQYLYQKSGSIFVPALGHGMINWCATTAMSFFLYGEKLNSFLEGPTGLIGIIFFGILAVWCYRNYQLVSSLAPSANLSQAVSTENQVLQPTAVR